MFAIVVLVISLSVYTYNFPYKTRTANILEVIIQFNFLTLLVLNSIPVLQERLFVFHRETTDGICSNNFSSISYLVILLVPVHYLPLLLFIVVAIAHLILYLYRYSYNIVNVLQIAFLPIILLYIIMLFFFLSFNYFVSQENTYNLSGYYHNGQNLIFIIHPVLFCTGAGRRIRRIAVKLQQPLTRLIMES